MSTLQAAVVAVITQGIALGVGLGAFSNQTAQLIVSFAGSIVALGFLIANAVEQHGKLMAKK